MPCRDYRADDDGIAHLNNVTNLKKRNDELAAKLCRSGRLIVELLKTASLEHREKDKKVAIDEKKLQIIDRQGRIREIKNLGGEPTKDFQAVLVTLKEELTALENSDPQNTTLY